MRPLHQSTILRKRDPDSGCQTEWPAFAAEHRVRQVLRTRRGRI